MEYSVHANCREMSPFHGKGDLGAEQRSSILGGCFSVRQICPLTFDSLLS